MTTERAVLLRRLQRSPFLGLLNGREFVLDMTREYEFRGALLVEGNFRRHRSFGAWAEHRDLERLQEVRGRCLGRRRLVAAMSHAVRALLVLAGPVGIPVCGLHQFVERPGVAFAQQVAGLLPAENVAGRHAPRRAVIGLVAGEEIEEQVRVDEIPLFALAHAEDLAEKLLGLAPAKEMLLVG